MDTETGLIYLRARYYDPSIGRFITSDPFPAIGTMTQDINRYVYTMNNTVNLVDPEGKWAIVDDGGAIVVGAAGGALWGIGSELYSTTVYGTKFDWGNVGISALAGATAAEVTLYAGPVAGGASGNFVYSLVQEARAKGPSITSYNWGGIGINTGLGGVIGGVSGPAGPLFGRARYRGDAGAGLFNSGDDFRVGWSWKAAKGRNMFSIHGGQPNTVGHWHIDLLPGPRGPW